MNVHIGIDPGLNGGITVLDENENIIDSIVMPIIQGTKKKDYDIVGISNFFKDMKMKHCIINVALEKSQPMFRDGKAASHKTGFGYGILNAVLVTLEIPFEIIPVKEWQKMVTGLHKDTKIASISFCKNKWPTHDWRATQRSKKDHDGKTDSACMAVFSYRRNK